MYWRGWGERKAGWGSEESWAEGPSDGYIAMAGVRLWVTCVLIQTVVSIRVGVGERLRLSAREQGRR